MEPTFPEHNMPMVVNNTGDIYLVNPATGPVDEEEVVIVIVTDISKSSNS